MTPRRFQIRLCVIVANKKDIMLHFAHKGIHSYTMEVFRVRSLQYCVYTKIWEERGNSKLPGLCHQEIDWIKSVSADLDIMSESTILWMTSTDVVNELYLSIAREICRTLRIRKIRVQVIIKLESFLLFQEL